MNKDVPTFAAKCKQCESAFEHPSLGDFSYGEAIFYTADGKSYVWLSGFSGFPEKVSTVLGKESSQNFWKVLASLADQINGQNLMTDIVCPHCLSQELEYWGGERVGMVSVPEASFEAASSLNDSALRDKIQNDIWSH